MNEVWERVAGISVAVHTTCTQLRGGCVADNPEWRAGSGAALTVRSHTALYVHTLGKKGQRQNEFAAEAVGKKESNTGA